MKKADIKKQIIAVSVVVVGVIVGLTVDKLFNVTTKTATQLRKVA